MSRAIAVCLVLAASASPLLAQNDDPPDLLRGAVNPYIPGAERSRFLKAAGVDTTLEQGEFDSDAASKDGFVRPFDKWPTLKTFDADKDGKLDWFEADAYRQALRRAVIAKYARDGRTLTPQEHQLANRDLAAGKIPALDARPAPAPVPPVAGRPTGDRGEFRDRLARGEERRLEVNQRLVTQYDRDGDGKLSASERLAMQPQEQMMMRFQDLGLRHFDVDGDGRFNETEQQSILAFGQKLQSTGRQWELKLLDTDGDGDVSSQERQQMQQKIQAAGLQLLPKAITWADADGDGVVSDTERQAAFQRVTATAEKRVEEWTRKFDSNGDGRLEEAERNALVDGISADFTERLKRHNTSGSAQLTVTEWSSLLEELAEEWGAKPSQIQ